MIDKEFIQKIEALLEQEKLLMLEHLWNDSIEDRNVAQWDGVSDDDRAHFRRAIEKHKEVVEYQRCNPRF